MPKNSFDNSNLRDMFENIDFDDFDDNANAETKVNIKQSQNNNSTCYNCNRTDKIVEDFSLGIIVCKNCGQVLDNITDANPEWRSFEDDAKGDNANRCGFGVSKLLPQSSLGTTIGGGKFKSRIKTLHSWSAMPYRERSLHQVFKQFQEKCANTGILKCIEDDAKIMYKAISECKHNEGKNKDKFIIIRGKNRISLIAACVFFACKRKGMTRSPKEIAEIFDINYTDITKGCKNFQKFIKKGNIDINTGYSIPEDFVSRFCKELHIKDKHKNKVPKNNNNNLINARKTTN
jgi:transcription initiation factor TFIIIB Brf1 subunit/transcription initiation factor TFIIB